MKTIPNPTKSLLTAFAACYATLTFGLNSAQAAAPEVAITSPAAGAPVDDLSFTIVATATDDGTITSVTFYDGATQLGDPVTSPPYRRTITGATLGDHVLTAKAIDNDLNETVSAAVTVRAATNLLGGKTVACQHYWYGAVGQGGLIDNNPATWNLFSGPPADNYTPDSDLRVSVSGFDSGVGLARYWGSPYANPGGNRALNGVTIYGSTTASTSLDTAAYTLLGTFSIPLLSGGPALPAGWVQVPLGYYYDFPISAPGGTKSLLFKFANAGIAGNFANEFNEIQAFAAPPAPPVVNITSPANNATVGTNFTINATATDDGSITSVTFFIDDVQIGDPDTSPPYSIVMTGATAGSHTLKAKAIDNDLNETTSAPVSVTVTATNLPPEVTLTSPADAAVFIEGTAIPLAATATDGGGVASVDFVVDEVVLYTDLSAPYEYTWTGAALGGHTVKAVARDGPGLATTSNVANITVNANQPPVVTLTTPLDTASFIVGTAISLAATATDDGGVASVDFVADDVVLYTDTFAPYAYSWSGATLGGHTVKAVARDGLGLETSSAAANIAVMVDPNVITTPLNLLAGKTVNGQHFWYAANGAGLGCLVDNKADTWCMFSGPPADNYTPDTDLRVSVSGFNSAVGLVRYWGDPYANPGGNRALNGVTIYSSTTSTTSLDTADYTLCGDFSIPLGNPVPAGWTLVPGAAAAYFDVVISTPPGTQSLLLKFKNAGIAGNFANLFNEIQAFAPAPAPAFSSWVAARGLAGSEAAFDADPDRDGIPNGIEFVIGGEPNPSNAGSNSNALLPTAGIDGSNFVFTFMRMADSAYLNPSVEFASDTGGVWTTAADPDNATIQVFSGSPADTVIVTIPRGANDKMFSRLRVANAP